MDKSKKKLVKRAVQEVITLKTKYAIPMTSLVNWATISYSSFMRLKRRLSQGESPVKRPGPKPTAPLDLKALDADIQSLGHGPKRTSRAKTLHKRYCHGITRRDLNLLVKFAREHANRQQNGNKCHLKWH